MKTHVIALSLFFALSFALAAIAQFAGILLHRISTPALAGGFVAAGVLAFAFRDYSRKPSIQIRRIPASSVEPAAAESSPLANSALDWTYAPRSA